MVYHYNLLLSIIIYQKLSRYIIIYSYKTLSIVIYYYRGLRITLTIRAHILESQGPPMAESGSDLSARHCV